MAIDELLRKAMQFKKGDKVRSRISSDIPALIQGQEYEIIEDPTLICSRGNMIFIFKGNYASQPDNVINVLFSINGENGVVYHPDYTCFEIS